jgi:hypothetical protein
VTGWRAGSGNNNTIRVLTVTSAGRQATDSQSENASEDRPKHDVIASHEPEPVTSQNVMKHTLPSIRVDCFD